MKLRIFVALLLVPGVFLSCTPVMHARPQKTSRPSAGFREQDMLNAIKKLEDELRIAVLKGDATWWNSYLSDEYSQTEPDGKVLNKAQTIEMLRSKYLIYDTMNFSDRTVHTFNGDTVVVTGRMAVEGTNEGKSFNGEFQFTRVWVKQGVEWKLASYQMTRTAPSAPGL